jgi:hypothetical protein
MSGLFETLGALRALRDSFNPAWEKPIVDRFRETYLKRFEEAKIKYCQLALDGHFLPDSKIKELLGYSSSSTVDAIREGKISLEKFDLLQATLGTRVPWPSAIARRTDAFVETVDFVCCELMKRVPTMAFDLTAYQCVEQSFAEDLTALELEQEGDERRWIENLFKRVKGVVPTKHKRPGELAKLLIEWGPAYLTTKNALANLLRE